MDTADKLVENLFSWVDVQRASVDKLKELASELEDKQKACNVINVVGSSVSVGGAAALTLAGVAAIFTAGAAIPVIAAAGGVASGLGLATNVGSVLASAVISSSTMEDAKKISAKIERLNTEIQTLMESLSEEVKEAKVRRRAKCVSPEDYVMDRILRAVAKRNGLTLDDDVNLLEMASKLPLTKIFTEDSNLLKRSALEMPLLSELVEGLVTKQIETAAFKKMKSTLVRRGFRKAATSVGMKASSKAFRHIGGGVVGLLFSVPELISDCSNLDNCETETSKMLRENAEVIRKTSADMKSELDNIEELSRGLADMKWKKYRKRRRIKCLC
ncbi:uncharacterized protein [Embiotoca jacksoni]|uniref:uncharacterized protein isoform X1 n=1 Tax=Embiotoca jacksoni TaxID=100190 RepID=UPI0037042806